MWFRLVNGDISEISLVLSLVVFGFDKFAIAMMCVAKNPLLATTCEDC